MAGFHCVSAPHHIEVGLVTRAIHGVGYPYGYGYGVGFGWIWIFLGEKIWDGVGNGVKISKCLYNSQHLLSLFFPYSMK